MGGLRSSGRLPTCELSKCTSCASNLDGQVCSTDLGATGPTVALLGEELVAEAGGLPEAAAELGAALKTSQLVACVADGAIGPWDCLGSLSSFRSWGFLGWNLVSEDFWLGT